MPDERVKMAGQSVMVLTDTLTGKKTIMTTRNIVTNDGDVHYAQRAGSETADNEFSVSGSGVNDYGVIIIGTAGDAPAKTSNFGNFTTITAGSEKSFDSGYPQTADPDGDNPTVGADVLSYRVSYGTTEANDTNIDRVCIALGSGTLPESGNPILMYATFASSVTKTATDTLKVFVNHTFNGV